MKNDKEEKMCISYKCRMPWRHPSYSRKWTKPLRRIAFDERLMRPDPTFVDERNEKEMRKSLGKNSK